MNLYPALLPHIRAPQRLTVRGSKLQKKNEEVTSPHCQQSGIKIHVAGLRACLPRSETYRQPSPKAGSAQGSNGSKTVITGSCACWGYCQGLLLPVFAPLPQAAPLRHQQISLALCLRLSAAWLRREVIIQGQRLPLSLPCA